ncbi:Flagellar hook-associated protein FliD [hydrothermal vent metagenome]|uniref:Filament cap protein n=1 Tax=hydrothermal vent metagenome TaxID=652676 RepID=A0A1W1CRW0_9ZZZZ
MGMSSLGAGSGVLTQDLIDKLKNADKAQYVTPIDKKILKEKSQISAFGIDDALMDNLHDSALSLTQFGTFSSRVATSSVESVANVTANEGSDLQSFSLDVSQLATKETDESDSFGSATDKIATDDGSLTLDIKNAAGDVTSSYDIDYNADMTLTDLRDAINDKAGDELHASIVQVGDGDFRLFLNANKEGADQNFSITDNDGNLSDDNGASDGGTNLTDNMSTTVDGVNAKFKYNGQDIERSSNSITDLLSGVTIDLKSTGTTNIDVKQDRQKIEDKINNFIDKYNSAMFQLNQDTKSSQKEKERGIFSSSGTMRNMKREMQNLINSVGGTGGMLQDYGIKYGVDGRLSLDSEKLNEQLDKNPDNVKAFFQGGTFTNPDGTTTELKGAFNKIEEQVSKYSKFGGILDNYKNSMSHTLDSLETQKEKATKRLEAKYATMAKRWSAYDAMISKLNAASTTLTTMIDALAPQK